MGKFIDLTGQTFGELTVIKRTKDKILPSGQHKTQWLCKCKCGNLTTQMAGHLRSGAVVSCGCVRANQLAIRNHKHGLCNTRQHSIWQTMKKRCYDTHNKNYNDYGGRGITVCDEWLHDFRAFYDWSMANGYADNLTIDRKDVNGNYEPSNCRWATMKEQANNTRRNHLITYNGKTQTIAQWADEYNLSYSVLNDRLNKLNWNIKKALTTP